MGSITRTLAALDRAPKSSDTVLLNFICPAPGIVPGIKQSFYNIFVKNCVKNFHIFYLSSLSPQLSKADTTLINKYLLTSAVCKSLCGYWRHSREQNSLTVQMKKQVHRGCDFLRITLLVSRRAKL